MLPIAHKAGLSTRKNNRLGHTKISPRGSAVRHCHHLLKKGQENASAIPHTIRFYLIAFSYFDSCVPIFYFSSIGRSHPFTTLNSCWGKGIPSSMSMGQDSSTKGVLVPGGYLLYLGRHKFMFLVFSVEAHDGRKELPRGTIVNMMFSSLHPPLCRFIFHLASILSLHHLLCFANTM